MASSYTGEVSVMRKPKKTWLSITRWPCLIVSTSASCTQPWRGTPRTHYTPPVHFRTSPTRDTITGPWAHVHEYKILSKDPLVAFPGNLQGRHIRETGPRGALLVTVENSKPTVERLFVDTVRWHRIEIDAGPANSLQDVVRLARDRLETLLREGADGRPLATRVIFTGRSRAHGELFGLETQLRQEILAVSNALGDNNLWIEKVILGTTPELDAAAIDARSDAIADLQGILAEAGSAPEIRQRIIDDLMELVGKAPLELIDAVPELGAIKAGEIDDQLEQVSLGLIAHMAGKGEPG